MRVMLGILLIGVAVIFLLFSIVPALDEDNEFVLNILETFYCDSGDQLSAEQFVGTSDDGGTTYSAEYTCTRRNESTYDVTFKSFVYTGGVFTVLLLLGIGLIIAASNRMSRNLQQQLNQTLGTFTPMTTTSSMGYMPTMTAAPSKSTDLQTKLQQLKEAYDQNLITQDEYERKRQEILNQF